MHDQHNVQPDLLAKPGAIDAAIDRQRTTLNAVAEALGGNPSRATIFNIRSKPGYGIAKDKAQRIADALQVPIGELFVCKCGTEPE